MVLGRVCFHIENAGMGGMGWGHGKGRDVMGWEWGWGEVRHVGKGRKIQITSRYHCGALLVSAKQLVAPLRLLFAVLFMTWGVLVPSWAKAPKKYENRTQL